MTLPIVCTLDPASMKTRREGLLAAVLRRADRQDLTPDGIRLRFAAESETIALIARTIDAERTCCRFLRFELTVEPDGGPVWLSLTGPEGTGEFLSALLMD